LALTFFFFSWGKIERKIKSGTTLPGKTKIEISRGEQSFTQQLHASSAHEPEGIN
jgi:hypothetical protein